MDAAGLTPEVLANGPARPAGLRERVGFALGALMLVVSVALALGLAAYARSSLATQASQNVDTLAQQMARELSLGMDRFAREIQLQAGNPVFTDPTIAPQRMRTALESIQRVYPEFAHISVVDLASARVVAATGGIFEGGDMAGRPVFTRGQEGLFVGDVHEAVRLVSLLPRPASGEPLRFLDVSAPLVGADGKVFRVLASHLSWEWARLLREQVLQPVEASRSVEIMLVDTAGNIVLTPHRSVRLGTPLHTLLGTASVKGPGPWADGKDYLAAEAPTFASGVFQGLGWRVVVRQPVSAALAPADRLRDLFLAGGMALGLLAAAIGWVVTGRLVKPVSDLARAASALVPGRNLATTSDTGEPELFEVAAVREAFHRVTGEALERAERLLDELNSIYQGAPVGLCVVGADLRYARVNHVWSEAFGLGPTLGIAARLDATGAPAALVDAVRQALRGDGPRAVEIETADPAGPRAWQTVLAPMRDEQGAVAGVSVVATDITQIRRAERALRLADERKNQFVSMLAHELRNPLAPIVNALHVLEREPTEAQARRMRQMMQNQLRRMVRLVDDLLDVSRVNLGKVTMRFELVSASQVCQAAIDSVQHMLDAKGQHVQACFDDDLPALWADKVRLEQVLCNLLGNASKYGRQNGWVRLAVSRDGAGDRLRIVVEDDGRGISPDFLPHVFELFAQENASMDRSDSGLGIGLSLVKNIVELHGGSVEVHSDGPGKGSRFMVTLPIHSAQKALAADNAALAQSS